MVRIALFLLLLLGAAASADEPGAGPGHMGDCAAPPAPADTEHGAWFYQQACAMCHGPVDLVRQRIQGETEADRVGWLDGYLQRHHCAADDALRADLIAYLLGK
jgi:hypothetical protein